MLAEQGRIVRRAENSRFEQKGRRALGMVGSFEAPKPALYDTPPPTRQHPLILSKQFHQLEAKLSYQNATGIWFFFKSSHTLSVSTLVQHWGIIQSLQSPKTQGKL